MPNSLPQPIRSGPLERIVSALFEEGRIAFGEEVCAESNRNAKEQKCTPELLALKREENETWNRAHDRDGPIRGYVEPHEQCVGRGAKKESGEKAQWHREEHQIKTQRPSNYKRSERVRLRKRGVGANGNAGNNRADQKADEGAR